MGSFRLLIVFGAGLIGIAYLAVWVTFLVTGQVEIKPTVVSIETVESEGFPDAGYLEVTGGYVVFSEAYANVTGDENKGRELFLLTAPVVSDAQSKRWRASVEQNEPIDASRFRLVASFTAEQVNRLWPEVKQQAETGRPLDRPPVQMTVTGETEPAQNQINKPMRSDVRKNGLDWKQARWLRFERHFRSLGRCVKNLAIGFGLLALAVAVFVYHRSVPDDAVESTLDVTPLFMDD